VGGDGPTTDLDLLVHLPEGAGRFLLGRFKEDLKALLHVAVDIVPDDGVKPRARANIDNDSVALCAAVTAIRCPRSWRRRPSPTVTWPRPS
jgi:hypothetical protein